MSEQNDVNAFLTIVRSRHSGPARSETALMSGLYAMSMLLIVGACSHVITTIVTWL